MIRRALSGAVALGLALGVVAGCAPEPPHMRPAVIGTPQPVLVPVTSPVDGMPIAVSAEGLTRVNGFTILTPAGQVVFTVGVLENGAVFPPAHIAEHMATATPIRVWFREEGGARVAYRLEDAPAP